jgi:hypothetical protein
MRGTYGTQPTQAADYRGAAGLLVRALSSPQLAPKRFWPALLFDAVPLLEGEGEGRRARAFAMGVLTRCPVPAPECLFSADDTYQLMRCLEDLLSSAADPTLLRGRTP